jgi:hypothetical protein
VRTPDPLIRPLDNRSQRLGEQILCNSRWASSTTAASSKAVEVPTLQPLRGVVPHAQHRCPLRAPGSKFDRDRGPRGQIFGAVLRLKAPAAWPFVSIREVTEPKQSHESGDSQTAADQYDPGGSCEYGLNLGPASLLLSIPCQPDLVEHPINP